MPITWRNIESDTIRGAAGLMEVARRAFNDGIGNFKGIVDDKNELNQANWDQQKANNTNAFLDRLAQYKTPEELAAAQASGELQALRQQYGGQVDATAIRGAEANAAEMLMKRIGATREYEDGNLVFNNQDAINRLRGVFATGDQTAIKQGMAELDQQNYGSAEEALISAAGNRSNTLFDQNNSTAQLGISQANLGLAQQRAAQSTALFNQSQAEYGRNEKTRVALESGNELATTMATQIGQSFKDSAVIPADTVESARTQLNNELTKNGTPPAVIEQLMTNFDSKLKAAHSLGAQGTSLVSAAQDPINKAYAVQMEQIEKDYKNQQNNPLMDTPIVDPEVTMDSLLKEVDPDGAWNGGEYQRLMGAGKELLGQDYNIGTADSPVNIRITQGMVKEALKTVNSSWSVSDWANEDEALKETIKKMVTAPGFKGRYDQAQNSRAQYVQRVADENSALATQLKEAEATLRKRLYPNR